MYNLVRNQDWNCKGLCDIYSLMLDFHEKLKATYFGNARPASPLQIERIIHGGEISMFDFNPPRIFDIKVKRLGERDQDQVEAWRRRKFTKRG